MTGCRSNSHGDFKKRFSLGVMADVKTLTDLEVSFINEHFEGVSFENDYCSVFFDGNYQELKAILQKFLLASSQSKIIRKTRIIKVHTSR